MTSTQIRTEQDYDDFALTGDDFDLVDFHDSDFDLVDFHDSDFEPTPGITPAARVVPVKVATFDTIAYEPAPETLYEENSDIRVHLQRNCAGWYTNNACEATAAQIAIFTLDCTAHGSADWSKMPSATCIDAAVAHLPEFAARPGRMGSLYENGCNEDLNGEGPRRDEYEAAYDDSDGVGAWGLANLVRTVIHEALIAFADDNDRREIYPTTDEAWGQGYEPLGLNAWVQLAKKHAPTEVVLAASVPKDQHIIAFLLNDESLPVLALTPTTYLPLTTEESL